MSVPRRLACLALLTAAGLLGPAASGAADTIASSGVIAAAPAPEIALGSETHASASDVEVGFNLSYPQAGDSLSGLTLTLAPGMTVNAAAAPNTCSSAQLQADACPAGAQIGGGVADVTLTNPVEAGLVGAGGAQTLSLTLYAMPAAAGAELGVGAVFADTAMNTVVTATGEIAQVQGAAAPELAMSLNDVPASLENSDPALTGFVLEAMELKLDGQAASAGGQPDDGTPLITEPAACSPARVALSVATRAGASGLLSDAFTPTGCPAVTPQPSLGFGFVLSSGTGARRITSVKLRLPRGLSFTASARLGGALEIVGARGERSQFDHGAVVITLAHVARRLTVEVEADGVRVGARAPARPRIDVVVTREDHETTNLHFTLGLQR